MASHSDNAAARYLAAAIAIAYGFAKLNGSQFEILDSEVTRPMGDVSGFWLTWYYFGYSPSYGTLLALIQIAGGLLLIWPRAALAGALLLFPVASNIVLIDIFYGVDLGATIVAALLTLMLAIVIAPHARRLRDAVIDPGAPARPARRHVITAAVMIVAGFALTYYTANYVKRAPTPIDGVWQVVADTQQPARWTHVFFERHRAHWAVFRFADGEDVRRHFDVTDNTVTIRERWMARDSPVLMTGTYDGGETLRLDLTAAAGGGTVRLRLLRGPR